eukprot:scaffold19984_cov127-Isochrysis_galbana.AAC.1
MAPCLVLMIGLWVGGGRGMCVDPHASSKQHATKKPLACSMQMQLYKQEWGYLATLACPGAGSSTRGRDRLLTQR